MTSKLHADRGRAAINAATKSAMVFLLPPFECEARQVVARSQAGVHVEVAIQHCIRAGRQDLAFALQEIGFELLGPEPRCECKDASV